MATPHQAPDDRPHVLVGEGDGDEHPLTSDQPGTGRFGTQPVVTLRSGFAMPSLGLGTYELEGEVLRSVLDEALRIGIRHIDTAQSYGNEREIGDVIAESTIDRANLFITTKIGNDRHEPDDMVESVEASLERLRTDHVDLLLVHWPVDFDRMGATLTTLAQLQASGVARHVGLSNFTIDQLDRVADLAPIEVIQCECHPFLQQVELRQRCVEEGWAFTAYSPIARGDVLSDDVLVDIAAAHDSTPTTVALAWLLAQPNVTAIPRTSDLDHLRDNRAALDLDLAPGELDRIATLDEGRRLVEPEHARW